MPPLGHHLRPKAINLYKTLHRLGVSTASYLASTTLVAEHVQPLSHSENIPTQNTTSSESCKQCELDLEKCNCRGESGQILIQNEHARTRRNAHLTDDKEIEEKLALGEFIRKGKADLLLFRARLFSPTEQILVRTSETEALYSLKKYRTMRRRCEREQETACQVRY
jgi:hypothetical protein